MDIDVCLNHVQQLGEHDADREVMETLAAEVERLRAENYELRTQQDMWQADKHLFDTRSTKVRELEAENVELRVQLTEARDEHPTSIMAMLRVENAELRAQLAHYDGFASEATDDVDYWRKKARDHWDACQGAISEIGTLKARLAWFEEYHRVADEAFQEIDLAHEGDVVHSELEKLVKWEADHPKPE